MRLQPNQLGHEIKHAQAVGPTVLLTTFADGQKRLWDLRDLGEPYGVFQALLDDGDLFKQVTVLEGGYGLTWPNGADVDADLLYHAGRAVYVVTMDYDAADDTLYASFHPNVGKVGFEPVIPGLSFVHDLDTQEWVGFQCEGFSVRVGDEDWLNALPPDRFFFPLSDPDNSSTLRDALLDARQCFLDGGAEHEPGLARAAR